MKLRHAIVAAICGSALLLAGAAGAQAQVVRNTTAADGVPAFGNVFMIIGENTTAGQIQKNTAPYVVKTLKPESASLTDYFALTHNSLANYVGLMSGQYTKCEQVDLPPSRCHQAHNSLFHQLDVAGISWQQWVESAKRPCQLKNSGNDTKLDKYRVKHVPALYFDNVEGTGHQFSPSSPSAECLANVLPAGTAGPNDMSWFNAALASGNVAQFNLIIPNECEDSHDDCPPLGNPNGRIKQFDQFLQQEVPLIKASPAWTSNSAILVVWDESNAEGIHGDPQYGGGLVQWILDSPLVQPGKYGGLSNHYSTLRMLEDGFGQPLMSGAIGSNPIPVTWK